MSDYGLEISGLTKTFAGNVVVNDVTINLESGHILGLVGPSGCGKTTTLRSIAGLEAPTAGQISIAGRKVFAPGVNLTPDKRDIGMVFQSYALWPHMTVFDNVAMPLRLKRQNRGNIKERVGEVLGLVGLSGLGERFPGQLSGGQQQRVAVARSLAARPQLLLLDEPLSNLDARLRDQVRIELRELLNELKITAVFVTHDQVEAMTLCDRIAVMKGGQIIQVGSPEDLYERPAHRFVAEFMGKANIIEGTARSAIGDGKWEVETLDGLPLVVTPRAQLQPGQSVAIVVRPEAFRTTGGPGMNRVRVQLVKSIYIGNIREWTVSLGQTTLRAELPTDQNLGNEGESVDLYLSEDAAVCIPDAVATAPELAPAG
jgi:iron(III) transport system ATP-binding protein